ncbi:hypothetical protein PybrP1_001959 [[Pythium] brassicae (nom. inval.)]|nr:hypothetical protein PybrP1_001959 [[Pythium] brassicae (nom. inval.)]
MFANRVQRGARSFAPEVGRLAGSVRVPPNHNAANQLQDLCIRAGESTVAKPESSDWDSAAGVREMASVLIQAIEATAEKLEDVGTDHSPAVVLLDFQKAYDTLDRDFLLMTIRKFGFGGKFV